jgi:hypothetical protein
MSHSNLHIANHTAEAQCLLGRWWLLMLRDWTSASSIAQGLKQAYGAKAYGGAYGNQFDVVGDTTPSAVANSQLHWGTDVRVFIEDQPLVRGRVVLSAIGQLAPRPGKRSQAAKQAGIQAVNQAINIHFWRQAA